MGIMGPMGGLLLLLTVSLSGLGTVAGTGRDDGSGVPVPSGLDAKTAYVVVFDRVRRLAPHEQHDALRKSMYL